MPKRFDAIAIQEDDWGTLNLFAVERTTGETHLVRRMKYDDLMADGAEALCSAATTFCVMDYDGVLAFFSHDGRRLFSTAAACDGWQGLSKRDFFHAVGDIYTFYFFDRLNNYCKVVIDPYAKTAVTAILFAVSGFPEFSAASLKLAWQTGSDLYAITRSATGVGFYWKRISNVWTKVSLGPTLDYGNNVDSTLIPIKFADGIIEWPLKDNAKSRNYEKFTLNINGPTPSVITAVIATNTYNTPAPPYNPATVGIQRSGASNTMTYGGGYSLTETSSFGSNFNIRGANYTLGAANSGPGGQGKGIYLTEDDSFTIGGTPLLSKAAGAYVVFFDFFLNSGGNASNIRQLIVDWSGIGLHMHNQKLRMSATASGSQAVQPNGGDYTVPLGQWIRIGICHAPAVDHKWRVSINGTVKIFDTSAYPALNSFNACSIGRTSYTSMGFAGAFGGFITCSDAGGFDHFGAALQAAVEPTTIQNNPIAFNAGPVRAAMSLYGDVLAPTTASDGAQPRFITDGSVYTPPTGQYTPELTGVARSWNEVNTAFKVGNCTFQIGKYGVRTVDSGGATLFQYLMKSDKDRELYYSCMQSVIRDIPLYEVSGTVKNTADVVLPGMTVRLLDDVTSEELAVTTTDANGVYHFYCLTNEKVAVKLDSTDPAKNAKVNAHITPTEVV